eukprot:g2356.t1
MLLRLRTLQRFWGSTGSACRSGTLRRMFVSASSSSRATSATASGVFDIGAEEHLSPVDAIDYVRKKAKAKFDETVDVAVRLNLDPRKPNQSLRKGVNLPRGTGKAVRVCVFAKGEKAEEAEKAGADVIGAEDLVKSISDGVLDFDRVVATPDMMPLVGRVARILGPRGLMPNPKLGTVTQDVAGAIESSKRGQIEIRTEKNGIVHAPIGKVSFEEEALAENFKALMLAIQSNKPSGAPKGKYILSVSMSSTMGPGVFLDVLRANPTSRLFMREDDA